MDKANTRNYSISRCNEKASLVVSDSLVVEEPLEIWVKFYQSLDTAITRLISTTMRTPGDDIELVKGWLFTSGLIDADHIQTIEHTGSDALKGKGGNRVLVTLKPGVSFDLDKVERQEYVNSSCGVCGQQSIDWLLEKLPSGSGQSQFSITETQRVAILHQFDARQSLFSTTGGSHSVALYSVRCELLDVREDVGRHNAFDKLIGANVSRFPGEFGVLISGRVSFEMVQKAAMVGIRQIIALGAPTSLAVDLCREREIDLIGFAREEGYNRYTGTEL